MTDNLERTIAALREHYGRWPVEDSSAWSGAIYLRVADLLALCDAAEAGLRCPPREPTQAMLDAGTIVYLREQQSRIPKWEPAIAARFWRAMYNEWINEGGQDAATLMGRGADAGEVTSADPVPPSPAAPAPAYVPERETDAPRMRFAAKARLETWAHASRVQSDEVTYGLERTVVGSVVAGVTADRCGQCGACDRALVPVAVGDREADDMELTDHGNQPAPVPPSPSPAAPAPDDLVDRLREWYDNETARYDMSAAADEITRLRAQLSEARAERDALRAAIQGRWGHCHWPT